MTNHTALVPTTNTTAQRRPSLPLMGREITRETLARDIVQEHIRCKQRPQANAEHAVRAGRLLLVIRAILGHDWSDWLRTNTTVPAETADNDIDLARRWPRRGKVKLAGMPYQKAVHALRG